VKGTAVRPTTDRVKEAVFNLVQRKVAGAVVLDLFGGSGAQGIEALSRGAQKAVFADIAKEACAVIQKNLSKIKTVATVLNKDYRGALSQIALSGEKFDLIFLDPPHGKGLEEDALLIIEQKNLLREGGVIVLETARGEKLCRMPHSLQDTDTRDYGSVTVRLIRRATKAAVTGTFDPFTSGHLYLVEKTLQTFDFVHIVVLQNPDKTPYFSLQKRFDFIEKTLKPFKKRIKAVYYEGMTVEYCNQNGIEYIVRGARNQADYEYEFQMAEYNKKAGGVTTLILPAKDAQISSTLVRQRLQAGQDIEGLVDSKVKKEIKTR
jgi:16S rRNA (guanine(966)-N(2))-methyltransferase RsmD/pantetheine-phosphate adenylyltransferase